MSSPLGDALLAPMIRSARSVDLLLVLVQLLLKSLVEPLMSYDRERTHTIGAAAE